MCQFSPGIMFPSNPFRINTCVTQSQMLILKNLHEWLSPLESALTKKWGEGGRSPFGYLLSCMPRLFKCVFDYLLCFQLLAHSFAPRAPRNCFGMNWLRTLSVVTGVWGARPHPPSTGTMLALRHHPVAPPVSPWSSWPSGKNG